MFLALFLAAWGMLCNVAVATAAPIVQIPLSYTWKDGYLYYGNYLVGCFNGHKYYGWDGSKWVDGTPTPVSIPENLKKLENFGVDTTRIKSGKCSVNGNECTKEQMIQAIEKGGLIDDTSKLHVTVIGENREKVVSDLKTSDFAERILVQSYPADHWAIAPNLHYPSPTGAKPVVMVQTSDGKVLHAQRDYDDGKAGLEKALAEAIRKPVPHTDPDKFPDLRKGVKIDDVLIWLTSKSPLGVAWWVVLATIGTIYYINRKNKVVK